MTEGEGRLVGKRYQLVRRLGSGGMGVVWEAWDTKLNRKVAVKGVKPPGEKSGGENDQIVHTRMLREASAAGALQHPGIVTVHDVLFDEGSRPWIVMELIEGDALSDVLAAEGSIAEERAAYLGIQILRALDFAHQRGILHRDIKPGNIMLKRDTVVLTDFGIATILGETSITATGVVPGSPEYIAPERLRGQEAKAAADLWAVGITLYAMVVGHTPFRRTDMEATKKAIRTEEPYRRHPLDQLWPVIQGLLRKDPDERLTVGSAVDMLIRVAATYRPSVPVPPIPAANQWTRVDNPDDQQTVAQPTAYNTRTHLPPIQIYGDQTEDPPGLPRPPQQRNRWPWVAAIGAIVAVVAVVAVVLAMQKPTTPSAQETQTPSSPSNSSSPPAPSLQAYTEDLGFKISVPADWTRSNTTVSAVSDVFWVAPQRDPRIGPLRVQVQRDTTKAGVTAAQFIIDKQRAESGKPDYQGSRPAPEELEYTHRSDDLRFHVLTQAARGGKDLYVLTFSMYASDEQQLRTQWEQAKPVIEAIRQSFQLTA